MYRGELDNCGVYVSGYSDRVSFDVFRKRSATACARFGCQQVAIALWTCAVISLTLTIGWTALFHVGKLRRALGALNAGFRVGVRMVFLSVALILAMVLLIGFQGTGTSTVAFSITVPLMLLATWLFHAAVVAYSRYSDRADLIMKSASMELPLFNVLVAWNLEDEDVAKLQDFRDPLENGLRLFEDIPELVLGVTDLLLFEWSWFAALGLAMSFAMIAVTASCQQVF